MTLTLSRPWSNICTAHRLIILDICVELYNYVNPTMGSKDKERTRKHDGQTDRQTENRTIITSLLSVDDK